MISWQLWQALQRPFTRHPLFRYQVVRHHQYGQRQRRWRDLVPLSHFLLKNNIWGFLSGALLVLLLCSGGWLLVVPLIALTPVALLLAGTIHGAYTAVRVASALAHERQQGHDDLNNVTPDGAIGAAWAICSYVYHTNHTMSQIRDTVRGVNLVLFIGGSLIAVVAVLNWLVTRDLTYSVTNPDLSSEMLFQVTRLLLALTAIYVDFIHASVLGAQLGILTATLTRSRLDASAFALGIFAAVQLLFYAATLVLVLFVLPLIFPGTLNPVLLVAQFALFVLAREVLIFTNWRLMADRLQSDPVEMQAVLGLRGV